jgi:hypothetical protein
MGYPTGETRHSRLIPDSKSECASIFSNLLLGVTQFGQRRNHLGLGRSLKPGAIVPQIIPDCTIKKNRPSCFLNQSLHPNEELPFAVIATIESVGHILRLISFPGLEEAMSNTDLSRQTTGPLPFRSGQRRTHGSHRLDPVAEFLECHPSQQRTVHPPRKSHQSSIQGTQTIT